ncbi:MAG: hypothetical protein ABIT83_14985 [Massilia sp.]
MLEHRFRAIVAMLTLGLMLASPASARARTCSATEATSADAQLDHLDTWAKVASNFRRFGHCDDGSIAEGNSEAIARLLIDHWDTTPTLVRLIKRDPRLQQFVLRHIDETLDTGDIEKIGRLASSNCAAAASSLCKEFRLKVGRLQSVSN